MNSEADQWFDPKSGALMVEDFAAYVATRQPIAVGPDDSTWSYAGGVWSPDPHAVRRHCAQVFGNRFKPAHVAAADAFIKGKCDKRITADPVPEVINVRNGLLDWRTGQLRPHTPDLMTTVQLPVSYDPTAHCPRFGQFVGEIVAPDDTLRIWEMTAYLVFSGNPFEKAYLLNGHGANGKSVLMRTWLALLGTGNVSAVSLAKLASNNFAAVNLFGKIANLCGDIDAGYLKDTATFKQLTGRDQVEGERKHRDSFFFTPWAVPVFSANKVPASVDVSEGYLRRWEVVNFPHSFRGREDLNLDAALATELPGIFAAVVRLLPALLSRGRFSATMTGDQTHAEFARRLDQVRYWLHRCTAPDESTGAFIPNGRLYSAYQTWTLMDGGKAVSSREFHERAAAAGYVTRTWHGTEGYPGLRVVTEATAPYPPGALR